MSFKDAVKVVSRVKRLDGLSSASPGINVGLSPADPSNKRLATSKAREKLNGRGEQRGAWPTKDELKSLSVTPTPPFSSATN
jgi:hypothetical protein